MNNNNLTMAITEADFQQLWAMNPLAFAQVPAIVLARRNAELEAKLAEVNTDMEEAKK